MSTDAEKAEYYTRRRARTLPALLVLFVTQQAAFIGGDQPHRAVDHVKIGAWVVMSVVILLGLATGGGWALPPRIRALMNDESTRAHRDQACVAGFWAAMAAGIGCYFAAQIAPPLDAAIPVHLIVTVGLATALLRFAVLERRALR